jgi:hypothetical protein
MKRTKRPFVATVVSIAIALFSLPVYAQDKVEEFGIFDHLSLGVTLGTTGIGFDLAAPVTEYLQLRAGYDILSGLKYKEDIEYRAKGQPTKKTEVEGKLHYGAAKLLLDVFPFRTVPFRFTTGFYLGTDEIIKAENTVPVTAFDKGEGLLIGDYIVEFDQDGIAKACIKVNKFRPYVGIGYGRSVPRKRIGVSGDLGVMFWGKPKLYEKQTGRDLEVTKSDLGSDSDKYFDIMSKITVYPVLTVRISGRIF